MPSKIIVRFKDNRVLKGSINDISTNKDSFYFIEADTSKGVTVNFSEIKAIFFVKSFDGVKGRQKKLGFNHPSEFGVRTVVKLQDGEVIFGYTQDYNPYAKGFYLSPDDKESNNTRIFIPNSSLFDIKLGEDIEKSEYAKIKPKFIQPIVIKSINVTIKAYVGKTPVDGVKIKVMEANQEKLTSKEENGAVFNLKPGRYNVQISYQDCVLKKFIEVSKDRNAFAIDLQKEIN